MAVHTELSKANINKILENYNLGQLRNYRGIKEGIENTNYLLVTESKKFIVTIFENRQSNVIEKPISSFRTVH